MLPNDITVSARVRAALDFALTKIGVCEDPPGSNRSAELDTWCREAGSPLGSFWCAITVWKQAKVGGLWAPTRDVGSCDEWVKQAKAAQLWSTTPVPGACVVYTNAQTIATGRYAGQRDAVHIGRVLRVRPVLQSIEGNTTLGKYDRNGYTQTLKEVETARVYGYILPEQGAA